MAKKIDVQKEPVKLREKVLKNGSISLFLDIWKIQCKLPPKTKRFCPLKES